MSDKQTEKTIQLDTPIKRGKTEITEIVLRKPQSGALRGTRLQAIMDMEVNALMTGIPRISRPALYEVDLINMVEIVDGVDLMEAHRNALGL